MPSSPEFAPRIVLVEDDPALRSSIAFALETEGFSVKGFARADEVMKTTDVETAACLVIDQRLPDGAGLSLLQSLRAAGCQAPAVLITSDPPAPVRRAAAALGVPIVEKPFVDGALFDCVRRLASAPGPGPRLLR